MRLIKEAGQRKFLMTINLKAPSHLYGDLIYGKIPRAVDPVSRTFIFVARKLNSSPLWNVTRSG
jgi:hypothetical protein